MSNTEHTISRSNRTYQSNSNIHIGISSNHSANINSHNRSHSSSHTNTHSQSHTNCSSTTSSTATATISNKVTPERKQQPQQRIPQNFYADLSPNPNHFIHSPATRRDYSYTHRFFPDTPKYDHIYAEGFSSSGTGTETDRVSAALDPFHPSLLTPHSPASASAPAVTPCRSSRQQRKHIPPPRASLLPSPKMNTTKPQDTSTPSTITSTASKSLDPKDVHHDASSKPSTHVITTDPHAVEVVLNRTNSEEQQQQQHSNNHNSSSGPYSKIVRKDGKKRDEPEASTPREHKHGKGKKGVITPEGAQTHSHHRSASYNTADFPSDLSNVPPVPDSPYGFPSHTYAAYSPYHGSSYHPGYKYPPSSPVKSADHATDDRRTNQYSSYYSNLKPQQPSQHQQSQQQQQFNQQTSSHSSEDYYRDGSVSPGKRQRIIPGDNNTSKLEQGFAPPAPAYRYPQDAYQSSQSRNLRHPAYPDRSSSNYYPSASVSDSFDSEHHGGERLRTSSQNLAPPQVSKSSSYPPPPSPAGYGNGDSSSASYPGTRRSHATPHNAGSDFSYPSASQGHAPPSYPSDHHGQYAHAASHQEQSQYYPDSRSSYRYYNEANPNTASSNYSYYDAPTNNQLDQYQQPQEEEVHPLLRGYDPNRDRRSSSERDDGEASEKRDAPFATPDRRSHKNTGNDSSDSVATTPSTKSKSSKSSCLSKRKPSTAAKAAIAAGMTQPASAREVDFDIHNPPTDPIIHPSKTPVCSMASNTNNNDVLCGRGGGTNTQIGNRRFRSLVQEFQPTYLLCRRKEKPLIARTIVLIVRNRNGRFLKKDDSSGQLYEVGDVKAEAKTSQALREGLDVRASKSTTVAGRKKQKAEAKQKKKTASPPKPKSKIVVEATPVGPEDVSMTESPTSMSQRDGPPSHPEPAMMYSHYPPPPSYYYGGGYNQYYPYSGYDPQAYNSPSRKRQRAPQEGMYYYPPGAPSYKNPYSYPSEYQYPAHTPAAADPMPAPAQRSADESQWEMDFNPPRSGGKKGDAKLAGEQ